MFTFSLYLLFISRINPAEFTGHKIAQFICMITIRNQLFLKKMIFPRGHNSRESLCFYVFCLAQISSGTNVNAMKNWYPKSRLDKGIKHV
jgi:hypothetical protein